MWKPLPRGPKRSPTGAATGGAKTSGLDRRRPAQPRQRGGAGEAVGGEPGPGLEAPQRRGSVRGAEAAVDRAGREAVAARAGTAGRRRPSRAPRSRARGCRAAGARGGRSARRVAGPAMPSTTRPRRAWKRRTPRRRQRPAHAVDRRRRRGRARAARPGAPRRPRSGRSPPEPRAPPRRARPRHTGTGDIRCGFAPRGQLLAGATQSPRRPCRRTCLGSAGGGLDRARGVPGHQLPLRVAAARRRTARGASTRRPGRASRRSCRRPCSARACRAARRAAPPRAPARAARRACRGCAASGRRSRCRSSARRCARTRRCASARGSARRRVRRGCSPTRPRTPGRRQQMPRMLRSTGDARLRRPVERLDAALVDERVHLHRDPRAARPPAWPRSCARSRRGCPSRMCAGATSTCAVAAPGRAKPVSWLNMSATSAPISLVARQQAEVGVEPRRLGVVVAGADVHVVAHAVALAAHDQDALGVRLERAAARRRRARPPPPARAPSRCSRARRSAP